MAESDTDNRPRVVIGSVKKPMGKNAKLFMLLIIVVVLGGVIIWFKTTRKHSDQQAQSSKLTFPEPKPTLIFQVKTPGSPTKQ